jgi:hypothetical protein
MDDNKIINKLSFGLGKVPQRYPQKLLKVGDEFQYEKKSIEKLYIC